MSEVIKLSDAYGYTRRGERGEMLWGDGVTNEATGDGTELCANGVIHAYRTPLLAALIDPIHADYLSRRGIAWLSKGRIVADDGLKIGCKRLTTIRRIDLPKVTKSQNIAFGILSVMEVYQTPEWSLWADNWLSGKDRSAKAAAMAAEARTAEAAKAVEARAAEAAEAAARAAKARAAKARAVMAAEAEAEAAKASAVMAAEARAAKARAVMAAEAAAMAAKAAEARTAEAAKVYAASAAVYAADVAEKLGINIDFALIAEKATSYK